MMPPPTQLCRCAITASRDGCSRRRRRPRPYCGVGVYLSLPDEHHMTSVLSQFSDNLLDLSNHRHLSTTISSHPPDVASGLRLRSANQHQLIIPRCRLNTYGRRAFSIAGPMVWNSLPDELRDPACGSDSFKQFLKTILFSLY